VLCASGVGDGGKYEEIADQQEEEADVVRGVCVLRPTVSSTTSNAQLVMGGHLHAKTSQLRPGFRPSALLSSSPAEVP
jgi:hypothetical protein